MFRSLTLSLTILEVRKAGFARGQVCFREEINEPPMAVDVSAASVTSSGPDLTLDCLSAADLSELTSTISEDKRAT